MKTTLATGLALAISASALVAPQAVALEDSSSSDLLKSYVGLTGGQLTWPIKQSFVGYINRGADAAQGTGVFATEQASFDATKTNFTFPLDAKDSKLDEKGNGILEFDGEVLLRAHKLPQPIDGVNYGLDIKLDDVKLKVEGTKATITADYTLQGTSRDMKSAIKHKEDDAELGTFTLDKPIDTSKTEFKVTDQAVTYGAGVKGLNLKPGETPEDAKAGLDLKIAPLNEQTETLKIVGIVLGVLLGAGALIASLAGPLKQLLNIQLPF